VRCPPHPNQVRDRLEGEKRHPHRGHHIHRRQDRGHAQLRQHGLAGGPHKLVILEQQQKRAAQPQPQHHGPAHHAPLAEFKLHHRAQPPHDGAVDRQQQGKLGHPGRIQRIARSDQQGFLLGRPPCQRPIQWEKQQTQQAELRRYETHATPITAQAPSRQRPLGPVGPARPAPWPHTPHRRRRHRPPGKSAALLRPSRP